MTSSLVNAHLLLPSQGLPLGLKNFRLLFLSAREEGPEVQPAPASYLPRHAQAGVVAHVVRLAAEAARRPDSPLVIEP